MTKKELVEKNVTSMIQLLSHLVSEMKGDHNESEIAVMVSCDFSFRLLNILLTGFAERSLDKRDALQKRRRDLKQAALPLSRDQLLDLLQVLRQLLCSKCNLHSTKGSAGMKQSLVLHLQLANRVC